MNQSTEALSLSHGLKLSFLITGVGMISTAYRLTLKLREDPPDLAIQAGIGGVNSKGKIGESYIIREDYFSDLGARENGAFKTLFELGLAKKDEFPYQNGRLPNPWLVDYPRISLKRATGRTVNEIRSGPIHNEENDILIESMEGAAFHYICLLEKIPFLQIRSVSNLIGERNKSKWKIQESLESLQGGLNSIIRNL